MFVQACAKRCLWGRPFQPSPSLFQLYHSSQAGCVPHSCRRHSEPQQSTPSCDVSLPKLNVVSPSNTATMAAEPSSNRVTCTWVQEHRAKHKPPWLRMSGKELVSFKQLPQVQQLLVSIFMICQQVYAQRESKSSGRCWEKRELKKKHIGMCTIMVLLWCTHTRQSIPRQGMVYFLGPGTVSTVKLVMHEHKHINATCTWAVSSATIPLCNHLTTIGAVSEQNDSTATKVGLSEFHIVFAVQHCAATMCKLYVLCHDVMIYAKEVTTHWHCWGQGNVSAGQQSS